MNRDTAVEGMKTVNEKEMKLMCFLEFILEFILKLF